MYTIKINYGLPDNIITVTLDNEVDARVLMSLLATNKVIQSCELLRFIDDKWISLSKF